MKVVESGSTASEELRTAVAELKAKVVFAHVGAEVGADDFRYNSQPFVLDAIIWMHQGHIHDPMSLRTELLLHVDSDFSRKVRGATNGELLAAYFSTRLKEHSRVAVSSVESLTMALRSTLEFLITLSEIDEYRAEGGKKSNCRNASSFNFIASRDSDLVASRLRTCADEDPPPLYASWRGDGIKEVTTGGFCDFERPKHGCKLLSTALGTWTADQVWLSSEPLDLINGARQGTQSGRVWSLLPKDSLVVFDAKAKTMTVSCMTEACERANRSFLDTKSRFSIFISGFEFEKVVLTFVCLTILLIIGMVSVFMKSDFGQQLKDMAKPKANVTKKDSAEKRSRSAGTRDDGGPSSRKAASSKPKVETVPEDVGDPNMSSIDRLKAGKKRQQCSEAKTALVQACLKEDTQAIKDAIAACSRCGLDAEAELMTLLGAGEQPDVAPSKDDGSSTRYRRRES